MKDKLDVWAWRYPMPIPTAGSRSMVIDDARGSMSTCAIETRARCAGIAASLLANGLLEA